MHYWEFSNTKPPEFENVKEPIVFMRWVSDVEGCFNTCSFPENLKVQFALNLLRLPEKRTGRSLRLKPFLLWIKL